MPRLFIHGRCTRLRECLFRYHYDEKDPESTEPVKGEFDHACDALRYLVVNLDQGRETRVSSY